MSDADAPDEGVVPASDSDELCEYSALTAEEEEAAEVARRDHEARSCVRALLHALALPAPLEEEDPWVAVLDGAECRRTARRLR